MKILLVLGKYLPDKKGGIETYCHTLAKALIKIGHDVDVAILDREKSGIYVFENINIISLEANLERFYSILQENQYQIVHFQEYHGRRGINIEWVDGAKQYCEKVFFTFHLPYLTCYKNDFRFLGIEDCDTFNNPSKCVKCIISTRLNYDKTQSLSFKNIGINLVTPVLEKTKKIKNLKRRIQEKNQELNQLINSCNQLFIYGAWFKNILIKNGYHSPKLKLIPHLINSISDNTVQKDLSIKNRMLFVGRIEEQKGLHLLCKAMNKIPGKEIELDVAGNIVDEKYFSSCSKEYYFNYLGALPHSALLATFSKYDFLVLPSFFTEMYSLVIREAFQAKLPVIASTAKGNIDVIREKQNGFLFEYGNYLSLASVIEKAFALKKKGWQPEFHSGMSEKNDLTEILSYYT